MLFAQDVALKDRKRRTRRRQRNYVDVSNYKVDSGATSAVDLQDLVENFVKRLDTPVRRALNMVIFGGETVAGAARFFGVDHRKVYAARIALRKEVRDA